jgi:hypothetical protein
MRSYDFIFTDIYLNLNQKYNSMNSMQNIDISLTKQFFYQ